MSEGRGAAAQSAAAGDMLSPYRVLDLTDEWGLLTGCILADLGADVLQIEPPQGSSARRLGPFADDTGRREDSLFWAAYARNKRGITLDLSHDEGRRLLLRLVEGADFLVESGPPGALESLGLGYATLASVNSGLVMASVTPFGQDGPRARWPATDLTVTAASNYLRASGDEDRAPLRVPLPQSFLHAAAEAATGCLVALHARRRSGRGQHVDVSAQEAMTNCTQSFILASAWNDVSFFRLPMTQRRSRTGLSGVYRAKDGLVAIGFFFGSALGPLAQRLMQWIYEEGMCDEATRDKDWPNYVALMQGGEEPPEELNRVHDVIEAFTLTKTKQELLDAALERGLMVAPVATTEDVRNNPHLAVREFWRPSGSDDDARTYPGPFAKFSRTPIQYRRRAPRLGEHNLEIYRDELGLDEGDLRLLAAKGVI